jgi:hypothetical protein
VVATTIDAEPARVLLADAIAPVAPIGYRYTYL